MKLKLSILALSAASLSGAFGQTNNYYGTSGALSANVWSTNPAGPYTSAFNTTGGGIINFGNAATQAADTNTIVVAGINATANFSITGAPTGTISSNAPTDGNTYNFGGRDFQVSYFGNYTGAGAGTFTGGNDFVLMAVPEPAAALLGSIGMLVLLRRRR